MINIIVKSCQYLGKLPDRRNNAQFILPPLEYIVVPIINFSAFNRMLISFFGFDS